MPDGHSTEKKMQIHPNKMRRQGKGFGEDPRAGFNICVDIAEAGDTAGIICVRER